MLVGAVLGFLIALLVGVIIFLLGVNRTVRSQANTIAEELLTTRAALGRFASLEQERLRIKEAVSVNFTEEQITMLANRIGSRCATIYEVEQRNALNKLD